MSALGRAGSPCSTAIWHAPGKIGGHGPHGSAAPSAAVAIGASPPCAAAAAEKPPAIAPMTSDIRDRLLMIVPSETASSSADFYLMRPARGTRPQSSRGERLEGLAPAAFATPA